MKKECRKKGNERIKEGKRRGGRKKKKQKKRRRKGEKKWEQRS